MSKQVREAHKQQRKQEKERRANREQTIKHKAKLVADYKAKREREQ